MKKLLLLFILTIPFLNKAGELSGWKAVPGNNSIYYQPDGVAGHIHLFTFAIIHCGQTVRSYYIPKNGEKLSRRKQAAQAWKNHELFLHQWQEELINFENMLLGAELKEIPKLTERMQFLQLERLLHYRNISTDIEPIQRDLPHLTSCIVSLNQDFGFSLMEPNPLLLIALNKWGALEEVIMEER